MVNFESIIRQLPTLMAAALLTILFLQSGLDKVFDRRGNLEWLSGHFSKTFLSPMVPLLLSAITIMELAAGLLAAAGILYFLFTSSTVVIFAAAATAGTSLLALFFGQRIAKDYPGAAVIVPYFILAVGTMLLTNPFSK